MVNPSTTPSHGEHQVPKPIAIIGVGFRGPGDATNVENLYKILLEGRETWSPIPESKWKKDAFYHPDPARGGTSNVQGGHFFKQDLSLFDAPFFNMREDEAAALDPQQRILLECTYEAFENSGIPMSAAVGTNTSVFVGSFTADYPELLYRDGETIPKYQATNAAGSKAMLSNRLSYFFDFKGPSVSVDTACSASLVALHLAFQSLQTGDADQALVAGSSVILNNDFHNSMSAMGFLSEEGRCYAFDERAQGYGRGEGVGCVLLKPLDQALKDGDPIRAIIRNTGSNQDGKTQGITLPSASAQESLIRSVYRKALLDPLQTSYVEAHGTGTQAGDPLETFALGAVFGPSRPTETPLRIGSVKSNLGHLEGASGILGVIKSVLMLENKILLPNGNFKTPNPRIKFDEWKLRVVAHAEPWIVDGPLRLSVNSFGYGGSNAHAILEDPSTYLNSTLPPVAQNITPIHPQSRVFLLSAFDKDSLKRQASNLAKHVGCNATDPLLLANLAYSLDQRRSRFSWKAALVAASSAQLSASLKAEDLKCTRAVSSPTIGFVFNGQGAQWAKMGQELIEAFPVYRSSLDRSSTQLKILGASWDLIEELSKDASISRVGDAEFSQPVCAALQCALIDLFMSWGIRPRAVVGHSSGEIAAAYCVGVMSLETTMTAAYYRGIVAGSLYIPGKLKTKGAMMAVALGKATIAPLIASLKTGRVGIACENSPSNVTVSGDAVTIDELLEAIKQQGSTFVRKLQVDLAYHSHHMKVIGDEYLAFIPEMKAPEASDTPIQFFSSVTASLADPSLLDRSYWVTNLLSEVRFSPALSKLCHEAGEADNIIDVLVEFGPHSALAGPIKQIIAADPKLKSHGITYLSALVRNKNAVDTVLDVAASLLTQGYPVNLAAVNQSENTAGLRPLINLPSYSWNHSKSYWAEGRLSQEYRNRSYPKTDVLGVQDKNFNPLEPRWRNVIRLSENPWIRDHQIQSQAIYPAGGFLSMALEAACQLASMSSLEVESYSMREVQIMKALVIQDQPGEVETLLTMKPYLEGTKSSSEYWREFSIYSVDIKSKWSLHCQGLISAKKRASGKSQITFNTEKPKPTPDTKCWTAIDAGNFYETLSSVGLGYGPTFARLDELKIQDNSCAAHLTIADIASVMPKSFSHPSLVHPSTFDSILHPIFAPLASRPGDLVSPMVPVFINDIFISADIPSQAADKLTVYAENKNKNARGMHSGIVVRTDSEHPEVVLKIEGLRLATLAGDEMSEEDEIEKQMMWLMHWDLDAEFITNADIERIARKSLSPASLSQMATGPLTPAYEELDEYDFVKDGTVGVDLRDSQYLVIDNIATAPPTPLGSSGTSSPKATSPSLSAKLAAYIKLECHKDPELKIMDMNSQTSSITIAALQALGLSHEPSAGLYSNYDVVLPEGSLVETHGSELGALSDSVNIMTFDTRKDLTSQGLSEHSYDLLIVTPSSTNREDLERELQIWKQLLVVGGRVIILNPPEHDWNRLLVASGYTGPEIQQQATYLIGEDFLLSKTAQPKMSTRSAVTIVVDQTGDNAACIAKLSEPLSKIGITVTISAVNDVTVQDQLYIVLAEMGRPFLSDPTEKEYNFTRNVFLQSAGLIWVTRGAYSGTPQARASLGFARTARAENGRNTAVTLDLDSNMELSDNDVGLMVSNLFKKRFLDEHGPAAIADLEYRELDGKLLIPRAIKDAHMNSNITTFLSGQKLQEQPLIQAGRPLILGVQTHGLLDSLYWAESEVFATTLPNDHIEVEIKAAGINFRDVMITLGQIEIEELGAECSGIVTAVGSAVKHLVVGDEVAFPHIGSIATNVQAPASIARRIPQNMSFETAAALPVVYITAYYSLVELARLQQGDSVLIHAAAGGVGQAAIEICKLYNAEIFVTVGTEEKKDMMINRFGIPEDHILYSRDLNFAQRIMGITNGRGVDVILNSVAGEALRVTWNCIAAYGRFVEIGKRDIFSNTRLEMRNFGRNVTFSAFDLVDYMKVKPEKCGQYWETILDLLAIGKVRELYPITTYPASKAASALQLMQSGKHTGKLVITMGSDDNVMAMTAKDSRQFLSADASYLIVGGLTGLGYAIATWMVTKGARHLIFANRSGLSNDKSKALVQRLTDLGAKVLVLACDVGVAEDVQRLASTAAERMPPVRGVIQSAMALRENLLVNMSHEDYQYGLSAKVHGTLNLHRFMPESLDFFIMLSSIMGVIGNPSQASYAAANAFLDAFAEYRNSLGMPAIALDLGVMTDVGALVENQELAKMMERQGFAGTKEQELLAMIQDAILRPQRTPGTNQIISGLGSWSDRSLAGLAKPEFSHFRKLTAKNVDSGTNATDILTEIQSLSIEDATDRLCQQLMTKISDLCMIPREDIVASGTPAQYGLDSLVAVELRSWIFHRFKYTMPLLDMMSGKSLKALSGDIAASLKV